MTIIAKMDMLLSVRNCVMLEMHYLILSSPKPKEAWLLSPPSCRRGEGGSQVNSASVTWLGSGRAEISAGQALVSVVFISGCHSIGYKAVKKRDLWERRKKRGGPSDCPASCLERLFFPGCSAGMGTCPANSLRWEERAEDLRTSIWQDFAGQSSTGEELRHLQRGPQGHSAV